MANLGNSKIKNTYQLVLQTDASGNLQKLDGSTPNPFIVNGNLRYADGTQNNGYVLLSDASGNASWGPVAFSGDVYISGGSIEGTTIELNASSGGTVSVPGLSWSSSTSGHISNSGLTGNVGIGTSTPNKPLTVVGDISGTTDLYIGADIYSGTTNLLDIFSNNSGTVTSVTGTAPVVSSGGNTPAISVTTAAVGDGGVNLATGKQIFDFVAEAQAGSAVAISVADTSVDSDHLLTFVTGPAEAARLYSSTNLKYNPSTRNLTSYTFTGGPGGFVGDLVGTATTATTVLVTDNESDNKNNLLVFVGEGTATTGAQSLQMDGDLYYNPSIGKLHVPLTLQMPDSATIKLGDSQDLKLYHDGDDSYIKENGTGDLIIQTNSNVIIEGTGGENCAVFVDEGGVELYYDNTKKFETTTDGVTMAGAIAMGTNKVTGMGDPIAAQDAATKNYVDTKTQMDWMKTTAGIKLLSSNNWVGFNRTTGGLDSSGFWNVDCLGTALSDVHAFYSSYYNTVFTAPYGGHLKRLLIQGANTTNAGAVGEDWNIYLAKSPVVNDSDSISWSQVTAFTRTFPDDRDKRFIYDIPLNGTTGVAVSQYDTFLLAFQGTNGTNTWVTANIILEFEYNI